MASEIDVCNRALGQLGSRVRINDIDDPCVEAELCKLYLESARDSLLESHPWGWARRFEALAQLPEAPEGWVHGYALPADCLHPLYLSDGTRPEQRRADQATPFEVLGGAAAPVLGCDVSPARLVYVARVRAVSVWPALAVEALVWRLAAALAGPLTGRQELYAWATKEAERSARDAYRSSLSASAQGPAPLPDYIAARGG